MVSFEDELMTMHIGKPLRRVAAAISKKPNGFLSDGIAKILFGKAQRRAERLHARMRRDLQRIDEHLSDSLAFTGRTE
jgi:preprotein translocase subunit SecA